MEEREEGKWLILLIIYILFTVIIQYKSIVKISVFYKFLTIIIQHLFFDNTYVQKYVR